MGSARELWKSSEMEILIEIIHSPLTNLHRKLAIFTEAFIITNNYTNGICIIMPLAHRV